MILAWHSVNRIQQQKVLIFSRCIYDHSFANIDPTVLALYQFVIWQSIRRGYQRLLLLRTTVRDRDTVRIFGHGLARPAESWFERN